MNEKILVVDDDPDILDALRMILESQGYKVITARNGIEGLANLKAEKPDLMILDLMMPKMDGFEVYKNLQQEQAWAEYKNTPVLILTSVREDASRRRYELETGQHLGVGDYIEKPFQPDMLLARVQRLLENRMKRSSAKEAFGRK